MISFIRYLWLFFIFYLPLVNFQLWQNPYDLPKILFFYLFSFLLILLTFKLKTDSFQLPKNFLILLGIFLFYLFSTFFSQEKISSLLGLWQLNFGTYTDGLIHLLTLILLFFSFYQLVNQKFLPSFSLYLSASAGLVSLWGFLHWSNETRLRSTIGEPNRLALFLISLLPLSFFLFLAQKKTIPRLAAFFNLLLIFSATVLTFSRTGWLALILLSLFFLPSLLKILKKTSNLKFYFFVFLVFLFVFAYFFGQPVNERVKNSFEDLGQKRGSPYLRLLEWQAGLKLWQKQSLLRKFIGTGPETLKFTYLKVRPAFLNQFLPDKNWRVFVLRNQYLHWLNTLGLVGLSFYFFLIFWTLTSYWQLKTKSLYLQGIFWSWLTLVISGFFYYWHLLTFVYFWLFLAILTPFGKTKITPLGFKIFKNFSFIFVFFGIIFFFLLSLSFFYSQQQQWPKALKLTPFFDFIWRQLAWDLKTQAFQSKDQKVMLAAIEASQKAYQLNPLEPDNFWVLHANLYQASGYLGMGKSYQFQALKLAQKWVELDPSNPQAYDALGLSWWDLGQLEAAQEQFQLALKLDSSYQPSWRHLNDILKQLDNLN